MSRATRSLLSAGSLMPGGQIGGPVQQARARESGYLLLASLVGLPSHAGLALSLAKRTREMLLGLPGLLYLHLSERAGRVNAAPGKIPLPNVSKDIH